jgi:hypothetical protein
MHQRTDIIAGQSAAQIERGAEGMQRRPVQPKPQASAASLRGDNSTGSTLPTAFAVAGHDPVETHAERLHDERSIRIERAVSNRTAHADDRAIAFWR